MKKVAINGFGRIGRVFMRQAFDHPDFEVVGFNDPHDTEASAHLLKYDSTYGVWNREVKTQDESLIIEGKEVKKSSCWKVEELPWKDWGVDIVVEATGAFRDRASLDGHLKRGAKKVVLTAPSKDELDFMVVMGVNHKEYDAGKHNLISNASCTTNSLAPVVRVLQDSFGIERGLMTTIHSFTNDQSTLDAFHHDLRRARTASTNIIPTTTGAAKAVGKIIPELDGRLTGLALRVPSETVSITDFVADLGKEVTIEEVNDALRSAAEGGMKGILHVSDEPLVSKDYRGSEFSSIVDGLSTMVIGGNMVKILCWYDNEWGYSRRLVDLVAHMSKGE
jgi:glyceraldehyde 3-phosphate dehydrogenase